MSNLRQHPRTKMKCRIKVSHESFGEILAQTIDLSDGGVYVKHEGLTGLKLGDVITGQVQDLPVAAPVLQMEVMRVDSQGIGLRFIRE